MAWRPRLHPKRWMLPRAIDVILLVLILLIRRLLRSVRLQVLGEGLATDLLALEDARHRGVPEVDPGVHARVPILLLGLAQALERAGDPREWRPARHREAQLIGAEEARHHHRGRPA